MTLKEGKQKVCKWTVERNSRVIHGSWKFSSLCVVTYFDLEGKITFSLSVACFFIHSKLFTVFVVSPSCTNSLIPSVEIYTGSTHTRWNSTVHSTLDLLLFLSVHLTFSLSVCSSGFQIWWIKNRERYVRKITVVQKTMDRDLTGTGLRLGDPSDPYLRHLRDCVDQYCPPYPSSFRAQNVRLSPYTQSPGG